MSLRLTPKLQNNAPTSLRAPDTKLPAASKAVQTATKAIQTAPRTIQADPKAIQASLKTASRQVASAPVLTSRFAASSFETKSVIGKRLDGASTAFDQAAVRISLAADTTYARLVADPASARALQSLKVLDGNGLSALGTALKSGKLSLQPEKQAALELLRKNQPDLHQKLLDAVKSLGGSIGTQAAGPLGITSDATQAADELTAAQDAYDDAHETATDLDEQLSAELADIGSSLTPQQQQEYIAAFHEQHKDDYEKAEKAADRLAKALSNPALDEAVAADPKLAYDAGEAATALADGPHSVEVLQWAKRAEDPNNPAHAAYEQTRQGVAVPGPLGPNFIHDPIDFEALEGKAAGSAAGQLLAQTGDVQKAYEQFESLVDGLKDLNGKTGELLDLVKKAASGDLSVLEQFKGASDALGKGLGAAAVVFAGINAQEHGQEGEYAEAVQDLASGGSEASELVADALKSFSGAGKAAAASGAVEFLEKLAPGLSAVANAIQFGQDAADFFKDPSAGSAVQAVGDLISVVGSTVGIVAPGVGQIIEGIGAVVSAIGEAIIAQDKKNERTAEKQELLEKVGLAPELAKTLATGGGVPQKLSEELGLTPQQIWVLANKHPELFENPTAADTVIDIAKAYGLEGGDVNRFINALQKDDPDYLETIADEPYLNDVNSEATQDAYEAVLRNYIDGGLFPSASEYAHEHSHNAS